MTLFHLLLKKEHLRTLKSCRLSTLKGIRLLLRK